MASGRTRVFSTISMIAAGLVILGVWLQVYLIASYLFGADSLQTHKDMGFVVHGFEVLAFLTALIAWRSRGDVGLTFALALVGTIQIALTDSKRYVGGLHGLFALVVLVLAVFVVKRGMDARADAGVAAPTA